MYTYRAIAKRVIDGDTIVMDVDLGFKIWAHDQHIRLIDVWAPELDESGGIAAKNFVELWLDNFSRGGLILKTSKDKKSFNRYLGHVFSNNGQSLNADLIESGHVSVTKPLTSK